MRACYFKWPEYFKTKSPEDLVDLRKTPYSFAYGREGLTFYEVLTENPERFNMFNKAMMQQEAGLPILGMFPFKSLEEQVKAEPDRAFMVDIGGGRGQALLAIANETGNVFDAHIYYYRRIMHNYQDDVCISILKQAVAAMGPTSRLLIADLVIPAQTEVGEDMSPYWMDMVMIAIGGKERSEKEFKQLLEDVGLEFVKVWREEGGGQAVVEGRLKQ
ncbi:putative Sterigmatocystin 8-O-methyltransferase [Glarea lozoyensis 74030]|uniref:Putative Sterigmatocystin 8-O-methyltransferase n=1 Tax=Glarea lozoyensis (strain ATCC 74030 / MF5533) TaxID=1104152 RepID=H0EVU3_GLAL7|nr:putative Sterigmatocystin 8-O-methyltransferase [Glarea lozoyensis 74030]